MPAEDEESASSIQQAFLLQGAGIADGRSRRAGRELRMQIPVFFARYKNSGRAKPSRGPEAANADSGILVGVIYFLLTGLRRHPFPFFIF